MNLLNNSIRLKKGSTRRTTVFALGVLLALAGFQGRMTAQTLTTGDVAGVVRDIADAVVPNATVTIISDATGDTRSVHTSDTGSYRLSFLKPGPYTISAISPGLKTDALKILVQAGQVASVDFVAKVQETQEIIEVTATAAALQTENANLVSTYSSRQIDALPLPGGDTTTVAYSVPGIVVSTGAGYGAFSSHGLPGTSNLFTVNGNDNMDPFLNLNNSGASNLTLGANEISEASVVQNPYSVQYGRQAGAQITYITQSGTNRFHGNLIYNYNDSIFNANDFFNNATIPATPRGKAVSNQYAASISGPVRRDKTFFYLDTEGLRYALPTAGTVVIPSQALQNYALANVDPSLASLYKQAFGLYNSAPGASRAIPVVTGNSNNPLQDDTGNLGCGVLSGTPTGTGGVFGQNVSCANAFNTNNSSINTEWLMSARVDHSITDNQKIFFRFKTDHGLQATGVDPINPVFNQFSNQPEYEGQVDYTYVISPSIVNHVIGSASYYSAIFGALDYKAALQALPVQFNIADGGTNATTMTTVGPPIVGYPQGRNVGQAQITDDISVTKGSHTIKVGFNYRKNRVTDFGNESNTLGPALNFNDLPEFTTGTISSTGAYSQYGSNYSENFAASGVAHISLYSLGIYAQDEWAMGSDVKMTIGVRVDRNANPTCKENCFTYLNAPFTSYAFQKGIDIPYNQSILNNRSQLFPKVERLIVQPRLGLVWSPNNHKSWVLRGGVGLFSDLFPSVIAESVFGNTPNVFPATVYDGIMNISGPGTAGATALASYQAFVSGFANGATFNQLNDALSSVGGFAPPNFYSVPSELKNPKYLQWNFELQKQFGVKNVLSVNYSGNHGMDLFIRNAKGNGYASLKNYPNGFGGLPTSAPDPRFHVVTQLTNLATSNYDGLTVQFRHLFGWGFQGQFGYTWSHALDDVSNGGVGEFFNVNTAVTRQVSSYSPYLNYGSADYDIRHAIVADFIWDIPVKFDNRLANALIGGWTIGSKIFVQSGVPFSVTNSRIGGRLNGSVDSSLLATVVDPNIRTSCTSVNQQCFTANQFLSAAQSTGWGNLSRNGFRGPGYFDMDTSLYKKFAINERFSFTFGASAYNLLNHPNFAPPAHNVGSPTSLGNISSTVGPPSSPYGSFQGAAVNGRVMVVTGKLNF